MARDTPKVFGEDRLNPICLSWDMDVWQNKLNPICLSWDMVVRLGPFGQKDYWKCYCECVTPDFGDIPFIVGNENVFCCEEERVLLRGFTNNKILQPVLLHE